MTPHTDQGTLTHSAGAAFDLARLIHPMALPTFRNEYWERQPLHIRRNDPRYFADLLTLDDVDRLLSQSGPDFGNIRVISEGVETHVSALGGASGGGSGINQLEDIYRRYRSGATVVLNSLERRWEPLTRLTSGMSAEANARFQVNVYLTPGGQARGFDPHYDTHDVIVLQGYGTKRWRLYGAPYALPLESQKYDHSSEVPEVEEEFDLEPGSLLYLPRGTIHAATSHDTASMHLTIGVHPVRMPSLIGDVLREVVQEDERFRRGLPIGFANDGNLQQETQAVFAALVEALTARLTPRALTERAVSRTISIAQPVLRGHLHDLESLPVLGPSTRVRCRPGIRWGLTADQESIGLEFHDKRVQLPARLADEVKYVTESGEAGFTADSITGRLDESGRLLLVRTLVREGFLTVG
ncbi:cupin domain-containing protein [Kitasatospora sp. NPDC056651]|uniref:cupin domain-containing protein n=1 Tax=Kitasatospora sp. NPDC056651 TaxID=3345892 RepID=UPI0036C0B4F2